MIFKKKYFEIAEQLQSRKAECFFYKIIYSYVYYGKVPIADCKYKRLAMEAIGMIEDELQEERRKFIDFINNT